MERIAILGCSGAGKSTLASARMAIKLKLPVIHLDNLFWLHGWKEMPQDQFMQLQRERLSGSRWVVNGNYSGSLHIRFELADTIVFLDFPRYRCLYRATIKRRWMYHNTSRGSRIRARMAAMERVGKTSLRTNSIGPHNVVAAAHTST
jgi:adenylate kinase family enzyme